MADIGSFEPMRFYRSLVCRCGKGTHLLDCTSCADCGLELPAYRVGEIVFGEPFTISIPIPSEWADVPISVVESK